MSFVYRYLNAFGECKYVGIVKANNITALNRRIKQHEKEVSFAGEHWKIEYIDGLSLCEADFLESYFISQNANTVFNKQKTKHQVSLQIKLPKWKYHSEFTAVSEILGKVERTVFSEMEKAAEELNLSVESLIEKACQEYLLNPKKDIAFDTQQGRCISSEGSVFSIDEIAEKIALLPPGTLCIKQIWYEILNFDADSSPSRAQSNIIRAALDMLGYKPTGTKTFPRYGTQRSYSNSTKKVLLREAFA